MATKTTKTTKPNATQPPKKGRDVERRGGKRSKSWGQDNPAPTSPHRWEKGESGNPKGAPKRGESWADVIRTVGNMSGEQAAAYLASMAQSFRPVVGVDLKTAVVLRVFAALLNEPSGALFNALMDRVEGKPLQGVAIADWRKKANEAGYNPDDILKLIDPDGEGSTSSGIDDAEDSEETDEG